MRVSQIRNMILLALLLALILLVLPSTIANFIIEYNWWKEVGQVGTWISMLWYSIAPAAAGAVVAFIALWVAHARGLHFAGVRRRDFRLYSRLVPVGLAIVAILFASASIDYWTVMRFFGSRGVTLARRRLEGPGFFARPAVLPVRSALSIRKCSGLCLCWRFFAPWSSGPRPEDGSCGCEVAVNRRAFELGPRALLLPGASRAGFVRVIAVILLLGLAAWVYLGNYDLLFNSHAFMTGADYVDQKVTLPLRWVLMVAILAAIPLAWMSRYKKAAALVAAFFILQLALPVHRRRRLCAAQ